MGDIKELTHFSQREGNLAPGDIGGLGNQEFKKTQVQLCYHHCLPKIVPKKFFFFHWKPSPHFDLAISCEPNQNKLLTLY